MIVVEGVFDPISEKEISALKDLYKKTKDEIFIQVKEEGAVLGIAERMKLIQHAIQPYRHFHFIVGWSGDTEKGIEDLAEEQKIREGYFRLAAYGTRKLIFSKGYYFEAVAQAMCKKERYEHSIRTAQTAQYIAYHQGVNPIVAYQAGVLHDITKAMSHEQAEAILQVYRPEWLTLSDKVWHSYTAVIWMKQNMRYRNHEILHAIGHHTLGDGQSKLAKILYIADKIEPGRGYDTSYHIQLACKDLDACVELVKKEGEMYRQRRNK